MFRRFIITKLLFLFSFSASAVVGSGMELVRNDGSLAQQWVVVWQGLVNLGWEPDRATYLAQVLDNGGRLRFLQQNRHLPGITLPQPEEMNRLAARSAATRAEEQRRWHEEPIPQQRPAAAAGEEDPEILRAVLEASRISAQEEEKRRAAYTAIDPAHMTEEQQIEWAMSASLREDTASASATSALETALGNLGVLGDLTTHRCALEYALQVTRTCQLEGIEVKENQIMVLSLALNKFRHTLHREQRTPHRFRDTLHNQQGTQIDDGICETCLQETRTLGDLLTEILVEMGAHMPRADVAEAAPECALARVAFARSRENTKPFTLERVQGDTFEERYLKAYGQALKRPVPERQALMNEYLWSECLENGHFSQEKWESLKSLRDEDKDIVIHKVRDHFEEYIFLQQARLLRVEQDRAFQESLRTDQEKDRVRTAQKAANEEAAAAAHQRTLANQEERARLERLAQISANEIRRARLVRFTRGNPDDPTAQ